jgi:uncharacterized repeat protein (TIGR03803 family)
VHLECLESRLVLTMPPYTVTQLASFPAGPGFSNVNGLAMDSGGDLFAAITTGGFTSNGGQTGDGSIVEEMSGSSTLTTLAKFDGANGIQPYGGVILDAKGDLFGVTFQGGTNDDGTVFELPVGSSTIDSLASFTNSPGAEGLNPTAGLVMDPKGDLFGETSSGGILPNGNPGAGTIFEVPAGTTSIDTLYTFDGTNFQDGFEPHGGLILDAAGDLFGVANGGSTVHGLVFELPGGVGPIQHVADFTIPNHNQLGGPVSGLVVDSAGDYFGETELGVYEVPVGTNTIQSLGTFSGPNPGFDTETNVFVDGSGNVFGTTSQGGTFGVGTAFEIENGSGVITTIVNFKDIDAQGDTLDVSPNSPLVPDGKGNFFGMTEAGGDNQFGYFYELSPVTATHLAFGPPSTDPIANQAINPAVTVQVEDAAGNIVTSDNSVVTLSIVNGPPGASFVGTLTAPAVNGVATFPGFVNLPGTYVFGAADGTLSPAQTAPTVFGTLPTSTIAFPTASSYTPETWTGAITGTAGAGAGTLASVGVIIFDGANYWNGADAAFDSATPISNAATLTQSNWSYAFPTGNLTNGKTYTVQSQAEDSLGNLQTLSAGMTFSFSIPAPTVTSISPAFGTGGGPQGLQGPGGLGTVVTITGTNLDDATAVSFGGVRAQFRIDSATQITAFAPAGGAGLVDVVVTNAGGSSAKSPADQFSFVTATISSGQPGAFVAAGPTLAPLANLPALPAGSTAPFQDAIGFTIANVGVGGTATIVIQLPVGTLQAGVNYSYDKFNPTTNIWSAFVTDTTDSVVFDIAHDQIDLTITDGGPNDQDGTAQGQIVDPGLPVIVPPTTPPSFQNPDHTTFIVGLTGSFAVSATGSGTITLGESGQLPGGVTFDPATGMLGGIPASGSAGSYALTLTASNGAGAPTTQSFSLTVLTPNQAYISAVFQDVLGRHVDPVGLQFFSALLDEGMARSAFVLQVNHSAEYFKNIIQSNYKQFLGRSAESAAVFFWSTRMAGGLTDPQFVASVLGSPEAFAHNGANDKQLIDAFYQTLFDRPGELSGETFWLHQLSAGSSMSAVALAFTTSAEFDRELITNDYGTLLLRQPEANELATSIAMLEQGMTAEDIVAQIATTPEYSNRLPLRGDL